MASCRRNPRANSLARPLGLPAPATELEFSYHDMGQAPNLLIRGLYRDNTGSLLRCYYIGLVFGVLTKARMSQDLGLGLVGAISSH